MARHRCPIDEAHVFITHTHNFLHLSPFIPTLFCSFNRLETVLTRTHARILALYNRYALFLPLSIRPTLFVRYYIVLSTLVVLAESHHITAAMHSI